MEKLIQYLIEGGAGTDTFRKNIFLNNTALQNSLGEENFTNVEVFFKNGASDQTALQEINAIQIQFQLVLH